ncbi:MAG: glycine cleavage system protein T [Phototrophicales bacterium]|nr:MAG: glycine cleavage system protein T [Phototrophicales bacterium]RMG77523.1 MAG: glycine cleavage system aminomethyltransferase GcvT [Chloroflexota bacterium]
MVTQVKKDFLFRGSLADIDDDVAELIRHETARQARYLIMIPSESTVPQAVREALSSAFHNIYAEGYPLESTRTLTEDEILDYNARLPEFRRQSDERYYKGTEYADIVEALARRRAAEVFAANGIPPEGLYVNVQPLSGAPANNAVYTALLNVGDTVMGMDLIQGGHLTHGSPVNRSGKFFNIISYGINPETGDIDYDQMMQLALEHKPKMIIGGYSSFPYQADWAKYREIADAVGAYLLADIAHVAGLVAAGEYPSPVGIADVVTFTTHKTLNGPRGAIIITHNKAIARKIDRGVFPGEQGGPHVNQIAALAVALKLAKTDQFRELQAQTVINAKRLSDRLSQRGLKIAYGGTNTHLLSIDLTTIQGADGTTLTGDMGARILDLVGIVANRQTIPGDTSALRPNGIRLGTPWITQRGFREAEIDTLADIIADVLLSCEPFKYHGRKRAEERAKIPFDILQEARIRVRDLAMSVGIDTDVVADDYPHFHYRDSIDDSTPYTLQISGEVAGQFLYHTLTSDVFALQVGDSQPTAVLSPDGHVLSLGTVERTAEDVYQLTVNQNAGTIAAWLRSISDGFVIVRPHDPYAKIAGYVDVQVIGQSEQQAVDSQTVYALNKAFFVGMDGEYFTGGDALPQFTWHEPENTTLKTTILYQLHQSLGAKMVPFAGYDMPVWYSSVMDEHLAVRNHAGVFDVTHMGVFDAKGRDAAVFLDAVTTNDVLGLKVGQSHYTYLLDIDGVPIDDLMIYRLAQDHFLVVVNAANNDKNWAWLNAIKNHAAMIDPKHPWRKVPNNFTLRDLRNPTTGADMCVDIALQGPASKDILLKLGGSEADQNAVVKLPWAGITRVTLGGFDLIVSRTGYTGERVAYELFVHPDKAPELFKALIDLGAVPCGLAARDSLRIEAGLPLYGHELAGELSLDPADAGFGAYVKLWKPFFVGKDAHIAREKKRDAEVVRFRLDTKGARPPHPGDPLVDSKGRVVGIVTSCSIDKEGYQLGQAYVKLEFTKEDTQLGVFGGSNRTKAISFDEVRFGKKFPTPERVTILSRFPK